MNVWSSSLIPNVYLIVRGEYTVEDDKSEARN